MAAPGALLKSLDPLASDRSFRATVVALLVFRLVLAAWLPITGDEAYFYLWGKQPDWGFYDHPPMVGWWLAGQLPFGDAVWWLRLPSILAPTLLAFAALRWLRPLGEPMAKLAAVLILLAPVNVWNVAITTDTPMMVFGVLSALAFFRAFREENFRWYALAGLLLAGAALSKYFSALLGMAFLAATLLAPSRRRFAGLFLIILLILPAIALMVWWNSENCWPNVLFNLYNRNTRSGFKWEQPALYLASLAFMLGFLPLWYGVIRGAPRQLPWRGSADDRVWWALAWVPLFLFGVVSLSKEIGMHWLLTFVPLTLIALFRRFTAEQISRSLRLFVILALVQAALALGLLATPLATWQKSRMYPSLVLTFHPRPLLAAIEAQAGNRRLFVEGYTDAATLSHAARRHIGVIGPGSRYARQDDVLTDFRELEGQDLAILVRESSKAESFAPFFRSLEVKRLEIEGAEFYVLLGNGFKFATYRDQVLREVRERYYQMPGWLPDCGCFFRERYFPAGTQG